MYKPNNGAIAFVEFFSKNPAVLKKFLKNVFGWRSEKVRNEGMDIHLFAPRNGPTTHMMAPMEKMSPSTVAFMRVISVDATSEKVKKNGGKVLFPKYQVPGVGWFCWYRDPGGYTLGVFQPTGRGRR